MINSQKQQKENSVGSAALATVYRTSRRISEGMADRLGGSTCATQ